jgi:pimeloyl-ACP methyl ester carboxylesterase
LTSTAAAPIGATQEDWPVRESRLRVNGIELAYRTEGDPRHPPVLLVMGFNMTLEAWPRAYIDHLLQRGYFVIRFDNRDVGASSRCNNARPVSIPWLAQARLLGFSLPTPYRLEDLAEDAVALLDALALPTAHVVGVSMGGMIAQLMAIHYPQRIRSLSLLMTHSGASAYAMPSPRLLSLLFRTPRNDMESQVAYYREFWASVSGPKYPLDPAEVDAMTRASAARSSRPHGRHRQLAAVITAPDRRGALKHLALPTSIVHGSADPLIPCRGGRALARCIPGARLKVIDGLGHTLPNELAREIFDFVLAP